MIDGQRKGPSEGSIFHLVEVGGINRSIGQTCNRDFIEGDAADAHQQRPCRLEDHRLEFNLINDLVAANQDLAGVGDIHAGWAERHSIGNHVVSQCGNVDPDNAVRGIAFRNQDGRFCGRVLPGQEERGSKTCNKRCTRPVA